MTDSITPLLSLLRTDDPPVEFDVIERVVGELRKRGASEVAAALAIGLKDSDPEYRCTIASVFMKCDINGAIPHVGGLVHDENDDVRGFACQELGAYRQRQAVPYLLDALANDPDSTNRTWAAWALGNIGDPAALESLTLAVQNDEGVDYEGRPVKKIAAEAIRRITQEKETASVA